MSSLKRRLVRCWLIIPYRTKLNEDVRFVIKEKEREREREREKERERRIEDGEASLRYPISWMNLHNVIASEVI